VTPVPHPAGIIEQEDLGLPAARFPAQQAGLDHGGVVQHENVSRQKEPPDLVEPMMGDPPRPARKPQKPRVVALRRGALGDQFGGQVVAVV
jgi:hypothetical protein